jgi:leukotriene-A4 hydrolase
LTSINYLEFKLEFETFVNATFNTSAEILSKMDWDAWVHGPGLAPVQQDFTTPKLNASQALADQYITLNGTGSPENFTDYKDFYSSLKVIFLNKLHSRIENMTTDIIMQVDKDLNVTNTLDPECKYVWFPLGILLGYMPAQDAAHVFISSMGRLKYLMPIY